METLPNGVEHTCGYPTCGDWHFDDDGDLFITVNSIENISAIGVMLHELIEAIQCKRNGVTEDMVNKHDSLFESERAHGIHSESAEPGDDPRAPYRREHEIATAFEMLFIGLMGKSWAEHNLEILS